MSYAFELPGVYLDNVLEDSVPAAIGAAPVLMNLDPAPGEIDIPKTAVVRLDIATLGASGAIDLGATTVTINGVLALAAGGGPANGFATTVDFPRADVVRITLTAPAPYPSESVVQVAVVSAAGGPAVALGGYSFTISDSTAPRVLGVEAQDLRRVRVTFSENVEQLGVLDPASALFASNWALARYGDGVVPIVSAEVTRVEVVGTSVVDVFTDIELTPNGSYVLTATNVADLAGNPVEPPYNAAAFTGWRPPQPPGRAFDIYRKLPEVNRQEDTTQDLRRFAGIMQEVVDLFLWDIDRFADILDPDLAPESFLDAMLEDLGNPFSFDLDASEKRRLARVLVDMYRLKGTAPGIQNVIRFFLGVEVWVDPFNEGVDGTLVLGESELGVDWTLGTGDAGLLYSFEVRVLQILTPVQRAQINAIVNFMKPAHEHYIRLVEPTPPLVIDHLELGLSELGLNWALH